MNNDVYDSVVIGSGAAGLAAAVYAGRYNMKTVVIGKEFGGETARAGAIWNYPGYIEIDGFDLMENMKKHAESYNAEVVDGEEVVEVKKQGDEFVVGTIAAAVSPGVPEEEHPDRTPTKYYRGKTVIYTIGSERRRLGLPNEDELTSKGVHYCATCDGPMYGGKTVAVVGGGDASVKTVNLLADYAEKIYFLIRSNKFRAEPSNVDEMNKVAKDKLEILFETEVKEIKGEKMLEKIVLSKEYQGSKELPLDGLFVEIGADPQVAIAEELGVSLDEQGYIAVDSMMNTNIPGAYAAGDVTNHFGAFKQDITAAAMGSVAATSAYEYLKNSK